VLEGLSIRPYHLIHHVSPLYPLKLELPALFDQDHESLSVPLIFLRVLIREGEVLIANPHTLEALTMVDKVEALVQVVGDSPYRELLDDLAGGGPLEPGVTCAKYVLGYNVTCTECLQVLVICPGKLVPIP
jgi:hypothetical protein